MRQKYWIKSVPLLFVLLSVCASPVAASPAYAGALSTDTLSPGSGDFVSVEVGASRNLSSLTVEAVPSTGLAVSGENPVSLGSMSKGETREVSFWVSADESADSGFHGLQIQLTGVISGGDSFTEERNERVLVTGQPGEASIEANSLTITPGGRGTVTIEVASGDGELRDASVRIVPQESGGAVSVIGLSTRDLGDIGRGERNEAAFTVASNGADEGVHAFNVVLDHSDGSVTRTLGVVVDGEPEIVISARAEGTASGVTIRGNVSNVGTGTAKGVILRSGSDSSVVGELAPDESSAFSLETERNDEQEVTMSYREDGERMEQIIHVPAPVDGPVIAFSEIDVTQQGDHYSLKGTVSNRGASEAFGLLVRVRNASGVEPVYPSRSYFVGSLAPDDFASFDLTFRSDGAETVEAVAEYQHAGRQVRKVTEFPVPHSSVETESGSAVPLLYVALLVALGGVAGAIAYAWRD